MLQTRGNQGHSIWEFMFWCLEEFKLLKMIEGKGTLVGKDEQKSN